MEEASERDMIRKRRDGKKAVREGAYPEQKVKINVTDLFSVFRRTLHSENIVCAVLTDVCVCVCHSECVRLHSGERSLSL